ncbi:hypothetical protein ZWY2020_043214 [Hordeum vulgare]|nr:hypothetical protein ZWY2020_043214 [Hordeum vulgare]
MSLTRREIHPGARASPRRHDHPPSSLPFPATTHRPEEPQPIDREPPRRIPLPRAGRGEIHHLPCPSTRRPILPLSPMALSRSLMREIRPPRVFASRRTGRASPNTLALTALILASTCLLVFGIFSLPVSSPIVPTTDAETELSGGREAASESSRPAHNHGRHNVR